MWKWKEIQTVLRKKDCISKSDIAGNSIGISCFIYQSMQEKLPAVASLYKGYILKFIKMKEVNKVVLLDELKQTLTAYEEPLKDLRDSL